MTSKMSATDETFAAADALDDARKFDEAFTLFMTLEHFQA